MTGISFINSQLGPKRIQLQRLLNSKTAVIAILVNPKNPNAADAKAFVAAGRSIGVDIVIVNASTEPKIKQALDRAVQQHAVRCWSMSMRCSTRDGGRSRLSPWPGSTGCPR